MDWGGLLQDARQAITVEYMVELMVEFRFQRLQIKLTLTSLLQPLRLLRQLLVKKGAFMRYLSCSHKTLDGPVTSLTHKSESKEITKPTS